MTSELKHCPFCAVKADGIYFNHKKGCFLDFIDKVTSDEIAAWNTRHGEK